MAQSQTWHPDAATDPQITIEAGGYRPGVIGAITALHAEYYHREWGLGLVFESEVATGLSEFLGRFDPERDTLLLALSGGRVLGSIAVDGSIDPEKARLRWFVLHPDGRGRGTGSRLLGAALDFCRARGHRHVHLWTFAGLATARHLYDRAGFQLIEQHEDHHLGRSLTFQRLALDLPG